MDDLIRREDAQKITGELLSGWLTDEERRILESVEADLGELPSVGMTAYGTAFELSPEQIEFYVKPTMVRVLPSEQDADAVEVVRCKDCIHYKGMAECECVSECGGTMWFCAWGEREEDDE